MKEQTFSAITGQVSYNEFKKEVLNDFRLAVVSRETSLLGRKEVLTGKAKFGIFGDGKELAQIAMAKVFQRGDWRSGYYRDQTFMFAIGEATVEQFFSQLYADPNIENDPFSGGRQMNAHFATRSLDENGNWKNISQMKNSSADASPTASQMLRAVGLALASKVYRANKDIPGADKFSENGNEVCFATIGDASTSEGLFWESVNAACVMKIPLAFNVWDDGYGISVPKKYQTTKGDISELLKGFKLNKKEEGMDMWEVNGWDYVKLCEVYEKAIQRVRENHIPALIHVKEITQPQGHSTSGSHERYKSKERLEWEREFDCNVKFREWIIETAIATEDELVQIEKEAKAHVLEAKNEAWKKFLAPIKNQIKRTSDILDNVSANSKSNAAIQQIKNELNAKSDPLRRDVLSSIKKVLRLTRLENIEAKYDLLNYKRSLEAEAKEKFNDYLHSESEYNALNIPEMKAIYNEDSPLLNGFEILNKYFDYVFTNNKYVFAFGEDVGKIGDVNQGFAGLQDKYSENRIFDVGIREATIMGQGIGMALRGLRPIAEIQYLDYLIYGLQPLCDDLATLQYRTKGGQKAPLIIRTRGHRLEGIWHTGSPISMILGSVRGIYLCVPRNMTQAAGFYNTLLKSDEPAIVIECLNGYRLKEQLPANLGSYTVPLGQPEVLHEGDDITIVTYGSCVRVAQEAMAQLEEVGISVELIDVQTLLPFDINHSIVESIQKTNRVLFLDEDVPGGGAAYMFQKVMEEQHAYYYLDSEAKTLTAQPHRAAYGSDGDYFSKPNVDDVFDAVYDLMSEAEPKRFPSLK
jgi:pyruvate/2-oxoglutarate/acetoin dehydrogenase E1 component/TPP-dependent pyruvate/acetoin dehydrogenase alpha subunit